MGELAWRKLMLNCAYNAIGDRAAAYGRMTALAEIRAVMREEVVAVARADGRHRSPRRMPAWRWRPRAGDARSFPPPRRIWRAGKAEIDHLNGFVAQHGAGWAMPTPMNTLHALVKLAEAARVP